VDNFNEFKKQAFKTFTLFQFFIADTQMSKLSKSFVSAISDMEKQVNRFIDLFSNLESKDFPTAIVKAIENIKKELAQFKQIVEDRIMDHVQNNILARSWVDNISDEIQQKVEKNIPFSVQLVNERNEKLQKIKNNE
jgi:dGTP triphosphohydrolase